MIDAQLLPAQGEVDADVHHVRNELDDP